MSLSLVSKTLSSAVVAVGLVARADSTRIPAHYSLENQNGTIWTTGRVGFWWYFDNTWNNSQFYDNVPCHMMDFGTPRTVCEVAIGCRSSFASRAASFKAWGSTDKSTWTEIYVNSETPVQTAFNHYTIAADRRGPWRYVKLDTFAEVGGDLSEFAAFSEAPMVTAVGFANPWSGTGVAAADASDGVKVTVKALNAAQTVRAFVAAEDYGDDYADWLANGTKLELGEVAAGSSVSGFFTGLSAGRYYWRAFGLSDAGATVVASDHTYPFAVGTTVLHPVAYVNHSDLKYPYDGSTGNASRDNGGNWMIFDLGDLGKNHLEALRVWTRDGLELFWRGVHGKIDIGYAQAGRTVDWGTLSKVSGTDSDHDVEKCTNIPSTDPNGGPDGITWVNDALPLYKLTPHDTTVANFNPYAVVITNDLTTVKPRYVRFRGFSQNNLVEIEFRSAADPKSDAELVIAGDPAEYGVANPVYGTSGLKAGVETTAYMTVTNAVSADGKYDCTLAGWTLSVSNASGVVETQGATTNCVYTPAKGDVATLTWRWNRVKKPILLPARYTICRNGELVSSYAANCYELHDGDLATRIGGSSPPTASDFRLDFGVPRQVDAVSVSPDSRWPRDCDAFTVWGSNDAETWTELLVNTEPLASGALNLRELPKDRGCFRYLKFAPTAGGTTWMQRVAEGGAYTRELLLKTEVPDPWQSYATDAPDAGIRVKATVLNQPYGPTADVVAYAARQDYGTNRAAWVANGTSISLGVCYEDSVVSGTFTGLADGHWFVRTFAVSGTKATVNGEEAQVSLGTVVRHPHAYVSNSRSVVVYDGNTGFKDDSDGWAVFDLKDVPDGESVEGLKLDTIRCWKRYEGGYSLKMRFHTGNVEFGYETGAGVEWGATTRKGDATRVIDVVSGEPTGIKWVKAFELMYVSPQESDTANIFVRDAHKRTPRYVRFKDVASFDINEIEFRFVKSPGLLILVR